MAEDRLASRLNQYQFRVATEDAGSHKETTVSATNRATDDVAGVLSVKHQWSTRGSNEQQEMERYGIEHTPMESYPDENQHRGQMRWSNGAFEPIHSNEVDYVNWLHVPSGDPHVLKGLMALAVDRVGGVPHADSELTEDGSRIARGLNRKMGLRGHPDNPSMRESVGDLGDHTVEALTHSTVASMWDTEDVPTDRVTQLTRSTFARPGWTRTPKPDKSEQLRLL